MRNKIALCLVLSFNFVHAQLNDKTWICGTPACRVTFQTSSIDTFQYTPTVNGPYHWSSISDNNGVFQFFTEGVNVYSYDGSLMANGTSLADNNVNSTFYDGLPDDQNVLILPKKPNIYYIIYQSVSDPLFAVHPWDYTNMFYYSLVDMDLQNGKGQVIQKRQPINSNYFMDGHLTACQHANGRDWWLVQRGYNNNRYFIYLVTPDTIGLVREQFIGAVSQEPDAVGQSAFSPDGSKYATITGKSPLIVLDFDRCEGTFSNPVKVDIPLDTFMFYGQQKIIGGGGNGLCFSPNNQYIYVNSLYILRQYDLNMTIVDSSEQVIFLWTDSNEYLGQFSQMQLAPNSKIYIANYQGITRAFHSINFPDSFGTACGFKKWGLPISTNNASQSSNIPHFRMGALIGSGCDTIINNIQQTIGKATNAIRVYPNPAKDIVEIDLLNYSQYHPLQQFYL